MPVVDSAAGRGPFSETSVLAAMSRRACSGSCKTSVSATLPSCAGADSRTRSSRLQKLKVAARVGAEVAAAYETKQAAARQITVSRETVADAIDSLRLNMINIRQAPSCRGQRGRSKSLQPIQALVQARTDYLDSVLGYNRAQFRLNRAIGQP